MRLIDIDCSHGASQIITKLVHGHKIHIARAYIYIIKYALCSPYSVDIGSCVNNLKLKKHTQLYLMKKFYFFKKIFQICTSECLFYIIKEFWNIERDITTTRLMVEKLNQRAWGTKERNSWQWNPQISVTFLPSWVVLSPPAECGSRHSDCRTVQPFF